MKRDVSAILVVDSDEESAVVVVDDDAQVIVAVAPAVSGSGWESRVAVYGLDPVSFRWLCNLGAPAGFFNVLHWLRASFGSREDLRCIDGFAGAARIFSAFSAAGLPSAAYDLDNDPVLQNILSAPGFITLVQWCRRLKSGSNNAPLPLLRARATHLRLRGRMWFNQVGHFIRAGSVHVNKGRFS